MFLAVGVVLSALATDPPQIGYRYSLILVLALAMGVQTAATRKLAVPDLTTTTFTQLIAATMIDSGIGGGKGSHIGRRILPFAAYWLALSPAPCSWWPVTPSRPFSSPLWSPRR